MADKKKNIPAETEEIITDAVDAEIIEQDNSDDALKSFLERSEAEETSEPSVKPKKKKIPKAAWWVLIGTVFVLIIVTVIILLLAFPEEPVVPEFKKATEMVVTVDEDGQHQVKPKLNSKGELENNSFGTLIQYQPALIKQMDIDNKSGKFSIKAETPYTTDKVTGEQVSEATVYTLIGYEDIQMQPGGPDTIANDCAYIEFTKVANLKGDNEAAYGFDDPRSIVKTHYVDGTYSVITVGKQAPNKGGSYVRFGTNKTIYLVDDEQVDGFLFSVLELMPLEINKSADTVENSTFSSIKLSGSAFSQSIELQPNTDEAIDMQYVMVSPETMFASDIEVSYISGAVRGLYAEKAVCVNPDDSKLKKYGLKNPHAKLVATYPDATITLVASKPNNDKIYILGESDIVYEMSASSVPWVSTSRDKLVSDVVLKPNFNTLTKIEVTDSSGTYTFDTTSVTETVETSEGVTETVNSKTAIYNGKTLDSNNYYVLYQNLCAMTNEGKADKNGSGAPVLTISLSYSTGRSTDTIKIYATNSTKYIAQLNSKTICLVSKNYSTNFSKCVQDLINGKTVSSF